MNQDKNYREDIRETRRTANDINPTEDEQQGYATTVDIRKGILGFMPAVMRAMNLPDSSSAKCIS